jgi:hypothetical protein
MKKKQALGVVVLTGAFLGQALAAGGSVSAAEQPVVTTTVIRGEGMFVDFERRDGCIHTLVSVFSNINVTKGSADPDTIAFVGISQANTCTLTTTIDGFGQPSDFAQMVKPGLTGGTLKFSVDFNNFAQGTVVPVTVDLSFAATSKATTTHASHMLVEDGLRLLTLAGTKSRLGQATGTVTFGKERVVAPDKSSVGASIDSSVNEDKTIARPTR